MVKGTSDVLGRETSRKETTTSLVGRVTLPDTDDTPVVIRGRTVLVVLRCPHDDNHHLRTHPPNCVRCYVEKKKVYSLWEDTRVIITGKIYTKQR